MADDYDFRYFIMLDPIKWQFGLSSKIYNAHQRRFRFKCLDLLDMKKFRSVDSQVEYKIGQQILCGVCNRWMRGLCFKHPLIFIKEEIPRTLPYKVFETIPKFLELKKSRIPNAGDGIFSKIDLPSGLVFGPYSGYLSRLKVAEIGGYSWTIPVSKDDFVYVDAIEDSYSNWMRYVNCSRFEQEQNMIGLPYNQGLYYCTYKPICSGSELLVWYGPLYGECLKIPCVERSVAKKAPLRSPAKRKKKNSWLK